MKLCARLGCRQAQGPSSVLQQEVPWSPQEAPQSLLREALLVAPQVQGQTREGVSLPSDFAPLEKGGPGRDGDAVKCVRHGFGDRV